MKIIYVVAWMFLLTSCASAPKPPECKGEFRPVNIMDKKNVSLKNVNKIVRCNEGDLHGNKS
jgi:hypothetical protein